MFLLVFLTAAGMFAAGYWVFAGMLRRLLRWHSRRRVVRTAPAHWPALIRKRVPLAARLDDAALGRLVAKAHDLVDTRRWEGCAGLVLTEEMQVCIAAQAALLVLEHTGEPYPVLDTILVYPSTFRPRKFTWTPSADPGASHATLGESWNYGVVILSWDSVNAGLVNPMDGRNVTMHEFAHQLDTADGTADGTPVMASRAAYDAWARVLARDFERLQADEEAGRRSVLDYYGTTNRAEFFAVATEAFFEKPRSLKRKYPELHAALASYYRQDPAEGAATTPEGAT